jgi:hypothetical protein
MELPIHSLNHKHVQNLVEIKQEQLHFNLAKTRGIEITTGSKEVADFLRIDVSKLGYISEDVETENHYDVIDTPDIFVVDMSSIGEMIDTRSLETKAKEEKVALLQKRPAEVPCTCFSKPCRADTTANHMSTCEW